MLRTAAEAAGLPGPAPGASVWSAAHVAALAKASLPETPVITVADLNDPVPGHWLWDFWPVAHENGKVVAIEGGELWMALAAPAKGDPVRRHDVARIRLLWRGPGGDWRDLGYALPDGFSPGSREWSGSATLDPEHALVTLFFTAAGRRGELRPTYEQRLFQTRATLGPGPRLTGWTPPVRSVASDGDIYHPANQAEGRIGQIKAFRDPAFFRDPADGRAYMTFAASLGRSASAFNGAVGLARADDISLERWTLMAPLVSADGLNNELERPHIVVFGGRYHLFWSTQTSVFAPGGPVGLTGLYGMVATTIGGPYAPRAPGALMLCNPAAAPAQAFSWTVTPDRAVASFIDTIDGKFAGCLAPSVRLDIA